MTGTTLVLPLLAAVMLVVCPLGAIGCRASHPASREPWSGLGPAVWLLPAALAVLARIG